MENTGKTHGAHRENTANIQGKHRDFDMNTLGMKVFVLVNSTVITSLVQMSKVKGQRSSLRVEGQGFISLETPTSRDRSKKVNS